MDSSVEEGAAASGVASGHEVARAAHAARAACSDRDVRAHGPALLGPPPCHTMAGGKAASGSASGLGEPPQRSHWGRAARQRHPTVRAIACIAATLITRGSARHSIGSRVGSWVGISIGRGQGRGQRDHAGRRRFLVDNHVTAAATSTSVVIASMFVRERADASGLSGGAGLVAEAGSTVARAWVPGLGCPSSHRRAHLRHRRLRLRCPRRQLRCHPHRHSHRDWWRSRQRRGCSPPSLPPSLPHSLPPCLPPPLRHHRLHR